MSLSEMFPGIQVEQLKSTLSDCGGDVDIAAQLILENGTSVKVKPKPTAVSKSPARSLLASSSSTPPSTFEQAPSPWAPRQIVGGQSLVWESPAKELANLSLHPARSETWQEEAHFPSLPATKPLRKSDSGIWAEGTQALFTEKKRQELKLKTLLELLCPGFPEDIVRSIFYSHDCNAELTREILQENDPETYRKQRLRRQAVQLQSKLIKAIQVSPPRPPTTAEEIPPQRRSTPVAVRAPSPCLTMADAKEVAGKYRNQAFEASHRMREEIHRTLNSLKRAGGAGAGTSSIVLSDDLRWC